MPEQKLRPGSNGYYNKPLSSIPISTISFMVAPQTFSCHDYSFVALQNSQDYFIDDQVLFVPCKMISICTTPISMYMQDKRLFLTSTGTRLKTLTSIIPRLLILCH